MRVASRTGIAGLIAGLLAAVCAPAHAAGTEPCLLPPIEDVAVIRHDVFPAPEAAGLARLANKLHINTRESVVARELLFAAGERLDPERLAQTGRNLRERPFLSAVRIEVLDEDGRVLTTAAELAAPGTSPCELLGEDRSVEVRVITRDAWSTSLEATLRQSGNRTTWELGVEESNLLGRGKSLALAHREGMERSADRLAYRDLQLAGGRHRLLAEYAGQSDGSRTLLEVGRPFLSLNDRWSWRLRAESFDQRQTIYRAGERIDRLRHVRQRQELRVSRLVSRRPGRALRLHAAFRRLGDEVDGVDRDFRVLQIGVSSVEHRFIQLRYVNHERPVDLNLGAESYLRVGASVPALGGGEDDPLVFAVGHRRGLRIGERRFLLGEASWSGRFRERRVNNGMLRARAVFLDRSADRRLSMVTARFRAATRLDPERQITLGAQNGLRGYPVHRWVGDRSLLLGLEHRWFFADDVLKVASLGVAAFVDSGHAWPQGTSMDLADLRTNLGVSLLIGRTRLSTAAAGMRIDLAYALDPLEDRGRWLLSFGRLVDLD